MAARAREARASAEAPGSQAGSPQTFGRGASPLVNAAPISESLTTILGNLTDYVYR